MTVIMITNNHYDDENCENEKDGNSPHHGPGNLLLLNSHKCAHLGFVLRIVVVVVVVIETIECR